MAVMEQGVLAVWLGRLAFCHCGGGWGSGSAPPTNSFFTYFQPYMFLRSVHRGCDQSLALSVHCRALSLCAEPHSWLCEPCSPLRPLAGNLLQIQALTDSVLFVLAGKDRCSLQEQAVFLPCAFCKTSVAPGSNPQVLLRPLLACVSRRMGHLWISGPYLPAAPQS